MKRLSIIRILAVPSLATDLTDFHRYALKSFFYDPCESVLIRGLLIA